ncbi:SLAM family member 6 isoform X2 [Suricata suricatta]|uniref:SLAM family member 6 isoform X2 n=1 Tax=Suricata suricatta TaxID=37032 RepID=UPI001155FD8C|nr:SLAM family member 6 isoform X2 [Suricata suricatta]
MTDPRRADTGREAPHTRPTDGMLCLLLPLALLFCLGPGNPRGNTASQTSSTPLMVNGTLGESVTFPLTLPVSEKVNSITWLYNGTSIAVIILTDASSPNIVKTNTNRKDRLQVTGNYSLQLSSLTMADMGLYQAQITTQTSTVFSSYTLRIFRQLKNLEMANHTWLSENGTCESFLTCSVENMNDDQVLRWEVAGNMTISEARFALSWDPRTSGEEKYTCIAENPVSRLSLSVSTRSLCEDFLNENNKYTGWLISVFAVIFICMLILGLFVWRKKYCLRKTAENMRNLEYVSVSSGNTVYAQVTHPNRPTNNPTPMQSTDSTTIYSTIDQSKESKPVSPKTTALGNVI